MSLLRIAFLPVTVKATPLSGPSMRSWIQRLLLGRGDVHELDAHRRAVGAAQDFQHLPDGGELEPQHVVDEDRPVVVGLVEAVGSRIELGLVGDVLQTQRIEVGVEMTAHAVGADHHQRVDRIARRLGHARGADLAAARRDAGLDLVRDRGLGRAPVAVERGGQFAVGERRPVGALPRGLGFGFRRIAQALEEGPPLGIDRLWVAGIARLKLFDVGRVGAVEEGSRRECLVRVLA